MTPTRIRTWPTLLIAVIALALAHPAQAVPPVGTVITETNVSTVTELISPVVEWSVAGDVNTRESGEVADA